MPVPTSPTQRTLTRRVRSWLAENRHLTPRRLLNIALVKLEMKLGRTRLLSRPIHLCIDVSNKCNLTCPFCLTGRRENGRDKGNVSFEVFRSIVDELAPYAMTLELFNPWPFEINLDGWRLRTTNR